MRYFTLFAFILFTFFLLGCSSSAPVEQPTQELEETPEVETPVVEPEPQIPQTYDKLPEATATLRACHTDADCVPVNLDCCGCAAGGKAVALGIEYIETWQDTLDVVCKDVACPAVMSDDPSCTAQPKCVNYKCTLA